MTVSMNAGETSSSATQPSRRPLMSTLSSWITSPLRSSRTPSVLTQLLRTSSYVGSAFATLGARSAATTKARTAEDAEDAEENVEIKPMSKRGANTRQPDTADSNATKARTAEDAEEKLLRTAETGNIAG